jgi:hypothetical protein
MVVEEWAGVGAVVAAAKAGQVRAVAEIGRAQPAIRPAAAGEMLRQEENKGHGSSGTADTFPAWLAGVGFIQFMETWMIGVGPAKRGVSAIDNNRGREKLRKSMKDPRKLTSQELFRIAGDPQAALLALAGGDAACPAIRHLGRKDGSAPKNRRKKSAAWKQMIALTEKSLPETEAAS